MANISLQRFDKDGIELIIDTQTGESFASVSGYARMSGKAQSTISGRLATHRNEVLKTAEILTTTGLKTVRLISEDLICQWLPKDNPELASQVLKLGVRLFLHTLAGFRVKSEAIAEVRQLESQIVKLSEEKQILEELIKTQKTMIADFSSKNSMLDYKRLVIEELHAEKERDIAKFNLLETEREKARGWRGGRMLMRNDKKR